MPKMKNNITLSSKFEYDLITIVAIKWKKEKKFLEALNRVQRVSREIMFEKIYVRICTAAWVYNRSVEIYIYICVWVCGDICG